MKRVFTLLLILIMSCKISAQTDLPKREYRGAWLSTVANIDWPKSPSNSTDQKKADLIEILDYLKDVNLNKVVFQIRPACDALYASEIEPWSYWLTGRQGKAPSPFFDPLEFAIEEAHKRGMELHAWFNPYRVAYDSWNLSLDPNNVAVKYPDWVLRVDDKRILDPGLPQVREHVLSVIMDVVKRYDVDGIHFDDYFYIQGISSQDDATYAAHNEKGITNKGDWRRDNVNELMRMIYGAIQEEDPLVKFGQSPAGIWKNGEPAGIFGNPAYSALYCDAVAWLDEQIIDYLTPQLYWPFGGGTDYGALMPWWVEHRNERHILPGLPIYRVGQSGFDSELMGEMVDLNRATEGCYGQTFFTSGDFKDNHLNTTTLLKNNQFKYKALIPSMEWKEQYPPGAPGELRFGRVAELGTTGLTWNAPPEDDVARYVIYSSTNASFDTEDPKNILDVTSKNYYLVGENFPTEMRYYRVTALDRNNNESAVSDLFIYQPTTTLPSVPLLVLPEHAAENITDTVVCKWNYAFNATSYTLQIAADSDFTTTVSQYTEILDTAFAVTGLDGITTYYWRVKSVNINGNSVYSDVFNFTTGFPAAPDLVSPEDIAIELDLDLLFTWSEVENAVSYQFQLFEGLSTNSEMIIIDTTVTDASLSVVNLKSGTFYNWRVRVTNIYGTGKWTSFKFKTKIVLPEIPEKVFPVEGQNDLGESVEIKWNKSENADRYDFQFSAESEFVDYMISEKDLADTSYTVTDLSGETTYYWRIRGVNNGGKSDYSETFTFTTGFPATPKILYPGDLALDLELDPILTWSSTETAAEYHVQLSAGVSVNVENAIVDTVVSDTTYYVLLSGVNTVYSWRVKALNNIGESNWTTNYKLENYKFKTNSEPITSVKNIDSEIPNKYELYQNYPNPFNPSTIIKYDLAEISDVNLSVYDMLGRKVVELVNENKMAGKYKIQFDAENLSSGIYFYRLTAGSFVSSKKLIFIK
ncbi:MAG: family 10 glycosylhydrolase [Melioribacteraceae bacterium]|nr:family 10 glycosylhydrolase [Melioribacteraceae bacterium]